MDLFSAIQKRRSIRSYLNKPVDLEIMREIIRFGTFAPTACNRQGWRFVIISDEGLRTSMVEKGGSNLIRRAPIGVLVLYNKFTMNLVYQDNLESASACIQNMLLVATQYGLGTCWINHLPTKSFLRKLLGIPKRYDIVGYITFGHIAREPQFLPRKYESIDELISHNTFTMDREIEKRQLSKSAVLIIAIIKRLYRISPKPFQRILSKFKEKIRFYSAPDHLPV